MAKISKQAHLILVIALALSLMLGATTTILAEQNNDEGSFDILILRNGDWQLQGVLSFSDYETLQLPLANDAGQLTLRLEQHGHDSAYVDCVAVQKEDATYSPTSAFNIDSGVDVLTKVLSPEYDVCDAWDSTLEIIWDNVPANTTLLMRAMEQDLGDGHGNPLYYSNLFFGQTLNYTLINDGGITVNGVLDESKQPDFSVFWQPDSPHPDGYTYGWLHSDGEYLYAAVEVTADNTPDEEDWGALYVMVNGEFKEFRISCDDDQWGANGFQYTSSVPYEHRIYEFQIPLTEIDCSAGSEVRYGFGCYGTVLIQTVYVDDVDCGGYQDGTWEYPFCTIEQGVNVVAENGTVYVAAGYYDEGEIDIERPMSLIGAGCGASYVDAEDRLYYVFGVFSDDVTISGFSISGALDMGIFIGSGSNPVVGCFIHDNCISDNGARGILLDLPAYNEIYCNDIYDNEEFGIYLQDSSNNNINNNNIYNNGMGIYYTYTFGGEDATNNWWGCSGGPGESGCDDIDWNSPYLDAVDFEPYSTTWIDCSPESVTVGGDVYPVDKVTLLAPWITCAVTIIAGGVYLIRRRIHSYKRSPDNHQLSSVLWNILHQMAYPYK
ncbi:NosD domain-containing protein [Chloroflexota bacterium]